MQVLFIGITFLDMLATAIAPNKIRGKYEVLRKIGEGGFGKISLVCPIDKKGIDQIKIFSFTYPNFVWSLMFHWFCNY